MNIPAGQRIAVIGTGVAGLGAAYLLSRRHAVSVFEALPRIGGHINTVEVHDPKGPIGIDTGFIVHNDVNYPNLLGLFAELDVPTQPSEMSFAVSIDDGALEWSGTDLASVFAQKRNLFRPRFIRMVREILRFNKAAPRDLAAGSLDTTTLGRYLDAGRYGDGFRFDYLLPMAAAIWSAPMGEILAFPAATFVRFFLHHGLLQLNDRPNWRTVTGGSRAYMDRLLARLPHRPQAGTPVARIAPGPDGVVVTPAAGGGGTFDHVVIATHADEALKLLEAPTADERRILGAFRFQPNRAVLHRDAALMPRRRKVWSSWNYLSGGSRDLGLQAGVSYWMNHLQRLDAAHDYFVTLNPPVQPRDDTVVAAFDYTHPLFDSGAIQAQQGLHAIQGGRRLWFCGAWTRYGFHEDGLMSAVAVARALGVEPGWRTAVGPAHQAARLKAAA